jgi:hypothetical protein
VTAPIDFDLHGCVGIRLEGATAAEERAVTRQLGPIRAPLSREPDLVIRFVDRLALGAPLRLLGVDDVGFTDDAFVVLRSRQKSRARVRIPLERVGGRCEIVCERGLAAVPHLVAIVNLTALANGALPLHASAFLWNGMGMLATGWAKGGKTESLLAFLTQGASYLGDEWVYLAGDGRRMFGIPEPIRVWDWQILDVPWLHTRLRRGDRARLAALRGVSHGVGRFARGRGGLARFARRVQPLVDRQRWVQIPPRETFGAERCVREGAPEKLFFVASHEAPEIVVRPADPLAIARRMVFSLAEERSDLLSLYRKFRFAFPQVCNPWLEGCEVRERALLEQALGGLDAFEVLHPYPVSIPALFDAMAPHCSGQRAVAATPAARPGAGA